MVSVKWAIALLSLVLLSACSSTPKSPESANIMEILFGNNVELYLANKKTELQQLENRTLELGNNVLSLLMQLQRQEMQLEVTKLKSEFSKLKLSQLQEKIRKKRIKTEKTYRKVLELKRKIQKFESYWEEDIKSLNSAMISLKAEIVRLENEQLALGWNIENSLNLQVDQCCVDGQSQVD